MKYLVLSFLLLFNAGCIGAGGIGKVEYTGRKQEGSQLGYKMLKPDLTIVNSKTPLRLSDVESNWGVPNKVVIEGKKKTVSYKNGLMWNGVVLLLILPMPLAVPVGYSWINFHFDGDELTNWTFSENHYCITYAGLNLIPNFEGKPLGLVAEISCDWHKGMPNDGRMVCDLPLYNHCYPDFFNH